MAQFPRGVHFITDRRRAGGRDLAWIVEQAVAGGVAAVHLREPDLPASELFRLAERLRAITAGRCALVINDRLDVALAAGADAVQLGGRSLSVAAARKVAGDRVKLGCSVHAAAEAADAGRGGADYVLVGTLFASASHPEAEPAGVGLVTETRAAVPIPVIGIGGITAANTRDVLAAGADGVAVIRAIQEAEDPAAAARQLSELYECFRA